MSGCRSFLLQYSILSCLLAGIGTTSASPALARSLRDEVDRLSNFGDQPIGQQLGQRINQAAVEIERNAVRSSDFNATATAPGFFYEFEAGSIAPERVAFTGAPIFVEPGYTLEKGRWDIAATYQYYDFTELDGDRLEDRFGGVRLSTEASIGVRTEELSLRSHVTSFSFTYGVTERCDVNVLVPLVSTHLKYRAEQVVALGANAVSFPLSADETRVGVGDVLVRAKLGLTEPGRLSLAALLTLRTPTGAEENFQGLGDVITTPLLAATYSFGRLDLDLNGGIDVNTDDFERNRLRYGAGATGRLTRRLALYAAVTGRSGLGVDRFVERGVRGKIRRSDIVDTETGVKVSVLRALSAYLGVIVPITRDGLRPDVVPFGGLETNW